LARDTSFYYSFLVLPADKRRAIVAVWDFCRAVDDAVDEAEEGDAAVQVTRWREELARCFDGGIPGTPQGRALQPLIAAFNLPRPAFEALIEGVEMDLGSRRYETFADLYEYCIRVASAVGLICLEIFGYGDPRSRQYAVDLGVALQLTNILRDVPEDLRRGRVYIPQEDLRRHGCSEEDLARESADAGGGVRSPRVTALLRQQAQRAREYYRKAAEGLPRADARRLLAAEIMAAIYRGILTRIERADYDVFSRVVRIPRPRRALIAAGTWARTAVGLR
jgi:phytoene synthase